jgi:hypothetical protein
MRALCIAAALVLATVPAQAAPPSAAPPTVAPRVALAPTPGAVRRDPAVALGLSLGVTGAGVALMTAAGAVGESDLGDGMALAGFLAILVGPTTGHIYADRIANPGLGIRAVSASVGIVSFSALGLCAFSLDDDGDDADCSGWALAGYAAWLVYAGGTVYEIADAPRAARAYNQRHGLEVALAPTSVRAGDGSQAPGLAVAGRF